MANMTSDRENIILQVTEDMIRQGGYHSFSFRNVAAEVGIKSSSVHYHFATKEELGVAVTRYYTDKFIQTLGDPLSINASGDNPIEIYIAAFRRAAIDDKGMCLCGMLGAEAEALPETVVAETRAFFTRNLDWLEKALKAADSQLDPKREAIKILALLEGAMLASNVLGDVTIFDQATAGLLET